ncbi:MAG TPA: tetratricopeptide repeat protein [Candidatus Dormibacteraeota bacterium]
MEEPLIAEILDAEATLRGPSPEAWFDRLDGESKRLETALASALEHDPEQGLGLAGAVWPYWLARGKIKPGRDWLGRLLDASEWGERTEARAKALYGAGTLAFIEGDREPSLRFHTESLAIARERRNLPLEADALIGLARVSLLDGNALVMQQLAQASLEAARAASDQRRVATALHHVVEALRRQGLYVEALPLYHQSLEAHRALGDDRGVALELHNLGNLARLTGDMATAESRLREALELAVRLKSHRLVAYCLLGMAHLARERGDWSRAARLAGASAAAFEKSGGAIDPDYVDDREKTLAAAKAALGDDLFTAEVAAGVGLAQETAVLEALATSPPA